MCHLVAFACVPSKHVRTNSTLALPFSVKPVAQLPSQHFPSQLSLMQPRTFLFGFTLQRGPSRGSAIFYPRVMITNQIFLWSILYTCVNSSPCGSPLEVSQDRAKYASLPTFGRRGKTQVQFVKKSALST